MTWPGIAFWILIAGGVIQRLMLLYVFTAAGAFTTLQMVPSDVVGGVNLLPQSICALCLIGKILLRKGHMIRAFEAALDPTKFGLLFLFLLYGFLSAYLMPRLFAGSVEVIPVAYELPWPVSLQPTTANITQSAYLALTIFTALAFSVVAARSDFQHHYLQAMLFGGVLLLATGLLDLATATLGLADLLSPFRNASYRLLIDADVLGSKRIVGFMPEASAYGFSCVAAAASLAFLRPFFAASRLRTKLVPAAAISLILMAAFSTSSTAYFGLGVSGVVFAFSWLRRFLDPHAYDRDGLKWEAAAMIAPACVFLFVSVISPRLLDPIYAMLNELVFQKAQSDSYIERTMWTKVGMDAFFATNGIGVGLGSARTSNWCVAVLSNTGVVGAILITLFIGRTFLARCHGDARARAFVSALKFSLLPVFAMQVLSGGVPDFGVATGAIFGMIVGILSQRSSATRHACQQLG